MKSRWAYSIRAEAKGTLEIDIYDVIGQSMFGGVTSADILGSLKNSKDAKKVLVRINSGGGDVNEGLGIYSLLREASEAGAEVTCRIDGLCASIATIIACAGDKIEMAETAYYMVHNPSAMVEGGVSDLRSMADLLDTMRTQMLSIYGQRTGKPVDELAKLCDAETWLTAEQALANGFVTSIIPSRKASMAAQAKWDLTQFRNVPKGLGVKAMDEKEAEALKAENEALKAKLAKLEEAAKDEEDEDKSDDDEDKSDDGDSEEEGGDEDAPPPPKKKAKSKDDEDDADEKASARARVIAVAKAITGVNDLEALEGALMALSTKSKGTKSSKAQHAESVAKAISDGKLLPSQKAWALGASPKAFKSYLSSVGDNVVVPLGEHKAVSEETAKARAAEGMPKSELSKSEQKFALQMGRTEAEIIKMKTDVSPV